MSIILNLWKICTSLWDRYQSDTLCCCLYNLGNSQNLADQTAWYKEGNAAEFALSGKIKTHRFAGLVVKASATGAKDPGFKSSLRRDFSGSNHTSDLKTGTPMAILPGAWHYRVSAGTCQPGVSILWLGEVESWIWNFNLSVAARKIVWSDPSLRYTSMLLGRQATNQQTICHESVPKPRNNS